MFQTVENGGLHESNAENNLQNATNSLNYKEYNTKNNVPVFSRLKEIILNHRRNSTTFETDQEDSDVKCSSGTKPDGQESLNIFQSEMTSNMPVNNKSEEVIPNQSYKFDTRKQYLEELRMETSTSHKPPSGKGQSNKFRNNHEIRAGVVSELVEKLSQANVIRHPLTMNDNQNCDKLKHITYRKKPMYVPPSTLSALSEELITDDNVDPQWDKSNQHSQTELNSPITTPKTDSPPSVGCILDNLGDTVLVHDSSLFSDIASSVEAVQSLEAKDLENTVDIMTEEETSPKQWESSKYSLLGSFSRYVSCENVSTRDSETSDCFESCLDDSPIEIKKNDTLTDVHLLVDSIINNIEFIKVTPVNRNLVTSTPERTCKFM